MQLELSNKLRGYLPDRSLKNIGEVGELLEETIKGAAPSLTFLVKDGHDAAKS
jgi:hypothetical protein